MPPAIIPLTARATVLPVLSALETEKVKLANITVNIVALGPKTKIAGVLSKVGGAGGGSISISSLSNDFKMRGVLTKYFSELFFSMGILTLNELRLSNDTLALKLRTAIKLPK